MHRGAGRILLTLGVVCGVVVGGVPPASAANPPASFLPDDDGAGISDGNILSDRFDGVDSRAHLTLVATPEATRAAWYQCPRNADEANGSAGAIDQEELGLCVKIGEDTEPTVAATAAVANEAYELFWDIPREIDLLEVDILALECVGDLTFVFGPGQTCRQTLEQDIGVDDAGIAGRTTSGDIVAICTADFFFGPGVFLDPCEVGGDLPGGGAQTYEGASALFEPFEHGDAVPNGGFVLRARTSTDAETIDATIDVGADRNTEPDVEEEFDFCSAIKRAANYVEWECVFTGPQVPDDNTMSISITVVDGAGGQCLFVRCILDSHFSVSTRSQAKPPSAYFAATPGNNDVAAGSSCTAPDAADDSSPGTVVRVHGCLQDQFGNPFLPPKPGEPGGGFVTFEQLPGAVGSLKCFVLDEDVGQVVPEEDIDGDGDTDRCSRGIKFLPADVGDDFLEYPLELVNNGGPGTQTVVFCVDREPQLADPQHGCADEPDVATVTEIWVGEGGQVSKSVSLAFTKPKPTDPADPCRTGKVSKSIKVGKTETLIACTFDEAGNAVSTAGAGGGGLEWVIDAGAEGDNAVEFVGSPPTDTGADGTTTTDIRSKRKGTDLIRVKFLDDSGAVLATAEVKIVVGGAPGGRTVSSVTIRRSFKGRVIAEAAACIVDRVVILKKKRRGRDKKIETDRTNSKGKWKIRIAAPSGRYYAKLKKTPSCTGDRSRTVIR